MSLTLTDTVMICSAYVCAIEYGDYTGLEDHEVPLVDAFVSQYPSATYEWDDESQFAKDAVSGLMADCVEVNIWQPS